MIANLEWYRVFYITAKCGSFSKAAEVLFITQPAISYVVKQLESSLGGKLFFRTSKGVTLTAEGKVLFQYIEQAYGFLTTAEQKIAEMHQLLRGEIRIGAGDTLCKHYLLPHLEAFHTSFPEIKIQVTNRTSQETVQLLKEGKIDFGIVNLPIEDTLIQIRETLEIQDCFVGNEEYRSLALKPISLQKLNEYPLIMLEKGSSTRRYIDHYAQNLDVLIQPEIELGSIDLLVQFARSGLGISCVVKNFIMEELNSSILYEIQLKQPIPPRKVGIVTLKTMPLSAAAIQLLKYLT
ncbi:MAG: transcriptional regulator [Bacilli bacterium]|jgi:LysR family cyn operon transcriptional activator|nr:transcriptional regulator [Bacilli bacterium]